MVKMVFVFMFAGADDEDGICFYVFAGAAGEDGLFLCVCRC